MPVELLLPGLQHHLPLPPATAFGGAAQKRGSRGVLYSRAGAAGPLRGPFGQRGRGGCDVRAAVGCPMKQPRRGDVLAAGLRLGETRVFCVSGRSPEASLSAKGKQSFKRKILCVCVLVRHLEISFVQIVASRCWHRCSFLLLPFSFPVDALVQN